MATHITSTVASSTLEIGLFNVMFSATQGASVLLDKIFWQQPVALNLAQRGAQFVGVAGTWRYTWSGLPADFRFYDITNLNQPIRLTGATATSFEDGPTAHRYLVTDPTTIYTPQVTRHDPVRFTQISGADAIYISPALFMDALDLLLQLRRTQGYTVVTVDVQEIYDAWSFGHVSPTAIRTFLRYAHEHWTPQPYSVVLVGDGSWDPHQYEPGNRDTSFIPPYLANVDPFLGEAACENCYVQLDGDDPLTGDDALGNLFSIDMWIGRLPVKSAGELVDVIKKLVSYETMANIRLWQNRVVLVADNYMRVLEGGDVVVDLAGNFAEYSDRATELSPHPVYERIYYDPLATPGVDPTGISPTPRWPTRL
ncbi:MAG: C25 family cysteine peptidase [Caldilineaceae bacterium]